MIFGKRSASALTEYRDVGQVMREVLYALIPGTALLLWYFGWGMVSNLVLSIGFALVLEWGMLKLRNRPAHLFLNDYSAVLTAWLLAVSMPAFMPWWVIFAAMVFAIVIAKHLYGGLGYNPFNPAMIGYAAMLVSYPVQMTQWPTPVDFSFAHIGLGDAMGHVFGGVTQGWDAFTGATPLDSVKVNLGLHKTLDTIFTAPTFGLLSGKAWEWVSVAWLVGGVWMIYRRIITWHIPVALLAGLGLMSCLFWLINSHTYPSPLFHLLGGAAMLGAFFIATDPVTASTTPFGKLIYASAIGALTYIIRTWGGYPDGIAFSVLIMNIATPLIDYYTKPRVFGTKQRFPP